MSRARRFRAATLWLLLAGAVALAAPAPAAAWLSGTHERIAADALELLAPAMRARLEPALAELKAGSVRPDFVAGDAGHHMYCFETDCGDAPDHLAAEYARLLEDFGGSGRAGSSGVRLLAVLALLFPAGCASGDTGADDTLAFRLGVLAHYVADLCVPYHTVPYVEPWKSRHTAFELDADGAAGRAAFDGREDDVGAAPREFALSLARAAHADLEAVERSGRGSAPYHDAIARGYARSVNAVADLWFSALSRIPAP